RRALPHAHAQAALAGVLDQRLRRPPRGRRLAGHGRAPRAHGAGRARPGRRPAAARGLGAARGPGDRPAPAREHEQPGAAPALRHRRARAPAARRPGAVRGALPGGGDPHRPALRAGARAPLPEVQAAGRGMSTNARWGPVPLARGLRGALALLALFCATTGQVGSCARERPRPTVTLDSLVTPECLSVPGGRLSSRVDWATSGGMGTRVIVTPSPARVRQAIRYVA